ncbi:MAG: helix-turn-helix domain-containing protein [Caldilineaceae bacterium]|nr:helix-turn-helix domain-containing protein [Caldilineaceae bacterium]
MTEPFNPWSVTELADAAGVSEVYIRRLCADGRIQAAQVGKTWVIPREVGDQWLASRRKKWDNPFNKK